MQGSIDKENRIHVPYRSRIFLAGIAINMNDACLIIKVLQSRNPRNLSMMHFLKI